MPIQHHVAIDRARKTAKAAARSGAMTHQQALDKAAQDAGYRHWSDMQGAAPVTASETTNQDPAVPTMESVEAGTRKVMEIARAKARSSGLKINEWVSKSLREAADRAMAKHSPRKSYGHGIRALPMDARMVAEALDPAGAPWEGDHLQVRCPLHDDDSRSLEIMGDGKNVHLRCSAGCSSSDLQDRLLVRLCEESSAATGFMNANDRSRVVSGHAFGEEGVGGAGGAYVLANGERHDLNILSMRMLTEGYPLWTDGYMPRGVAALDRAMRVALAGQFHIETTPPEDRAKGLWKFEIVSRRNHDRYRILLSGQQGEQPGLNACHRGSFSVVAAETFASNAQAVDRMLDLTRSFETLDPAEKKRNEVSHVREIARNASLRGTVKGWGWWTGPYSDEFNDGPYKTKAEAISQGNGSCMEEGEHFYVIQALVDPRYLENPEGNAAFQYVSTYETDPREYTFFETRGLKRCRAT